MTKDEKIKKIQAVLDSHTPRLEIYCKLFDEMEDNVYNYTDYVVSTSNNN